MNFNRLSQLNELITDDLNRKPIIILKPNQPHPFRMYGTANDVTVNIDAEEWIVPDKLKPILQDLCQSKKSIEEKILEIYRIIGENYTYDDNALSYVQKIDDELFFAPDSYGRDTNHIWKENRKKHNRRTCYEISRILAECINEILKSSKSSSSYDVCIFWDETVTHYFVGLVSDEYAISLDIDDFTKLKDITRLKTELAIEGVKVYYDTDNKFTEALKHFNDGRGKVAKDYIGDVINSKKNNLRQRLQVDKEKNSNPEYTNPASDDILFLKNTLEILKNEYHLDPAGIFEYMKEIVDTKIGAKSRKKVWKEVSDNSNNSNNGNRYTRCLIVTIDSLSYIIDVTKEKLEEIFREFNLEELNKPDTKFKKNLSRNWGEEPYNGR